jgi:hypothetical protein
MRSRMGIRQRMSLGRCPTCNGKFQIAITWGYKGECIDCYVGRMITEGLLNNYS